MRTLPRPLPMPLCHRDAAFTLVELLSVIALIALLASSVTPAFNALQKAAKVTSTADELAGVLALARAQSRAKNTWIWVGIKPGNSGTLEQGSILIRTYQSKDGTYNLAADNLILADKERRLERFDISDAVGPYAGNPRSNADTRIGRNGSWLICSPSGEVKIAVNTDPVEWGAPPNLPEQTSLELKRLIEIGLVPNAGNAGNTAVIQIAGLNGQTRTYRP